MAIYVQTKELKVLGGVWVLTSSHNDDTVIHIAEEQDVNTMLVSICVHVMLELASLVVARVFGRNCVHRLLT